MLFSIPKHKVHRILVVRGDNIGDWVLTIPTLSLLRETFPQAEISVLGKSYIRDAVLACPFVDQFIPIDPLYESKNPGALLIPHNFDLSILIQPPKIARWFKEAKIPYRIGALNRGHSWLSCNYLPWRSNRKNFPHEAQKTTQFLKPLGIRNDFSLSELIEKIVLEPKGSVPDGILHPSRHNLILHPGSNFHGREWPIGHFLSLIALLPKEEFHFIFTGSKEERKRFAPHLPKEGICNAMGETTLNELMLLLREADGVVASGTGTLHLAAALGTPTLGLFPPKFKMGKEVWQPLGKNASFVEGKPFCKTACSHGNCPCMEAILPEAVRDWLQITRANGKLKVCTDGS